MTIWTTTLQSRRELHLPILNLHVLWKIRTFKSQNAQERNSSRGQCARPATGTITMSFTAVKPLTADGLLSMVKEGGKTNLDALECWNCKKKGHYASKCPD